MVDLTKTPDDLPIPQDDGSANHLPGMTLPSLSLLSTNGNQIDLGSFKDFLVIYCYPMTGQPNVPLPDGWDQIPGASLVCRWLQRSSCARFHGRHRRPCLPHHRCRGACVRTTPGLTIRCSRPPSAAAELTR